MNLIGFLDLLGVIFLLYATWTILHPAIRKNRIFNPLALLVLFFALNAVPNFFEWIGFEDSVEPFEEYIQILVPAAFFMFFSYANFLVTEEAVSSRNKVLMAIHTITQKLEIGAAPEELWKELLGRVINVMGFDGGFIDFPEERELVSVRIEWEGWKHFSKQLEILDIEDTILSEVIMTREPMVVDRTDSMPDTFIQALSVSGVRSVALFPVFSEARVMGVMGIVSRSHYSFTREELDLFSLLGHHFGEIIHNSILLSGVQGQADELKVALDARRYFIMLISDDLWGPLMRIRTVLERLQDEIDPEADPERIALLREADADSFKLERIIDDVRELSLLDSAEYRFKVTPVNILKMIQRVVDQYQLRAEDKGVFLGFDYGVDLSPLEGDRDMIHSALRHLVSNAIKYTPEGGRVTIHAAEDGERIFIHISDTGIGIKEEDSEKVFDMFYRATKARDKEGTGTGLGLTIARRIIRLHQGDVTFKSGVEGGTVFTVSLPRLQLMEDRGES